MQYHQLSWEKAWLLKEKYGGEKSAGFFTDCKRLAAGEPLGYVIGHVPFLGCTIWLDSHPLIPRPETEYWVEQAIETISENVVLHHATLSKRNITISSTTDPASPPVLAPDYVAVNVSTNKEPAALHRSERPQRPCPERGQAEKDEERLGEQSTSLHILDLCAGSGAIGVAVAKHVPGARVDFGEIDAGHLPTITKNLQENQITPDRSCIIESDLFERITKRYDYILTNPPYIDPALDRTEASVKGFEPHQALYGGQDGLALIKEIIALAPPHLTPRGQLWIEHEPEQTDAIHTLASTHGFSVTTHLDQYQLERYSVLVLQ